MVPVLADTDDIHEDILKKVFGALLK